MLAKQIINTTADLLPDYENKKLVIMLHSLSAPRFNAAGLKKIIPLLMRLNGFFQGNRSGLCFLKPLQLNWRAWSGVLRLILF
jgi:hypothetical protein